MLLEVREELEKVFNVLLTVRRARVLEIILLVLEGFLYSTRETKVNESVHFDHLLTCQNSIWGGPSVPSAPRLVEGM